MPTGAALPESARGLRSVPSGTRSLWQHQVVPPGHSSSVAKHPRAWTTLAAQGRHQGCCWLPSLRCQGVPEAAAPQAAPPAPSPSGCCEGTPRRAGGRARPLQQTRGEPPALTGEVLPSMGRGRGWAGLRAAARPCQRRGAERGQLRGRARSCLALARQCQRRQQTRPTCPAPAPPVSQRCGRSSDTCALRPAGMRGRAGGDTRPQERQHPAVPRCSPGCLPTRAPLPPLCAPTAILPSREAQPCPARRTSLLAPRSQEFPVPKEMKCRFPLVSLEAF